MTEPATQAAMPPVPTDRDLRDRIAEVLARADGWGYASGLALRDMGQMTREQYGKLADAVLAVLPAPTSPAPRVTSHAYEGDGGPCTAEAYGQTCGAPRAAHELDEAPICTQESARTAGLDVAPSPAELAAMAESIIRTWGERHAEPDDETASIADAGAQLARAVPLLLARLERMTADRDRWCRMYRAESRTVWDTELPPGGECCADCGQPVESEPCPEHNPAAVAQRYAAALTRLDRMATAWLEQLPEAIRTATAAEAVHYVVRSALHPLPGSATVRPVRYEVSVLPEADINNLVYALAVEDRGAGRWAVVRHQQCLGRSGQWSYELRPTEREEEWMADHRFDLETALRLAEEAAPSVIVNGISAAEVAARAADGSDH